MKRPVTCQNCGRKVTFQRPNWGGRTRAKDHDLCGRCWKNVRNQQRLHEQHEDALGPARGILNGCIGGAAIWGTLVYLLWRVFR